MVKISRRRRIVPLLGGLLVFAGLVHSSYRNLVAKVPRPASALGLGATVPLDLNFAGLGGNGYKMSDFSGRVVLINFWAGWCAPCLREMPGLYGLYGRLKDRGFSVLAVNMDDDPVKGLSILRRTAGDAPFPMSHGQGSDIAGRFNISALPFTVIVGRDGTIVYAKAGEVNWKKSGPVSMIEGML